MSIARKTRLFGFLFVSPTLLFFAVFKYAPMIWAVWLSFTSYDMLTPPRFIGLANYREIFADPIFRAALINTFVYMIVSTGLITLVSLGLALAINPASRLARHCMSAMFLANLTPIIAVCVVWKLMLHPYGALTQLLRPVGVTRVEWLTDPRFAMPVIIAITVWRVAPYFMVVFLAGLLAIPLDCYEAARLDGANAFNRFRYITLPLLAPTAFFVVVVAALLSARVFLLPYFITGGGPGNATRVLSMLIYETGFSYLKMGQAAAISVVLFGIMLVLTSAQIRLFTRAESLR